MYPFITIWWQHIEMTGLWVIIGIGIFCLVCAIYAKRMKLNFSDLFYALPSLMIIVYFFGSYGGFVLKTGHLIPYSIIELGQIIIPPEFGFHAWSLAIGIVFSTLVFLYKLPKHIRKNRVDCLSVGYMVALIIVGIFFVLWDHMIGLPTISNIGISSLTPYSEVSKFTRVYPVWFFLSISALFTYIVTLLIFRKQVTSWRGFGSFSLFFFLLAIVLLFQNYPKHGVISIGDIRIDINQYMLICLSIVCLLAYIYNYRKESLTNYQQNQKK